MNKKTAGKIAKILAGGMALCLLLTPVSAVAEEKTPLEKPGSELPGPAQPRTEGEIEERLGIRILGIREAAAGNMLDLRYRVLDPDKASALMRKGTEILLVDQKSGAKLSVPRTKIGPMRQTALKPVPDRNYFVFFGNADKRVKAGDRVTLVIDGVKIENLMVE